MAESLGQAVLDLRTNQKQYNQDMARAETRAERLDAKFKLTSKTLKSLGGALTGLGTKMSTFVTAPIVGLGALAAKLADTQLQAERGLEAALAFADAPANALPGLKEFASELQGLTTVGDETSLKMLQVSTSMGLTTEQSKTAVKEAIGLAKAFGINEASAVRYTAALAQGDTTMLNRYIPSLRAIKDDSERVAKAHELMGGAFAVARAEAETGLGPWKQLSNQFGDLLEDLGKIILEGIAPLAQHLASAITWVKGLDDNTKRWVVTIGAVLAAIGPVLIAVGTFLTVIGSLVGMLAPGGALIVGFTSVVAVLTGPIGIALAIGAVALAISSFIAKEGGMLDNWAAGTKETIEEIRGSLTNNTEAINTMADAFRGTFPELVGELSKGVAAGESFESIVERMKEQFVEGTAAGDALRAKLGELTAAEMAEANAANAAAAAEEAANAARAAAVTAAANEATALKALGIVMEEDVIKKLATIETAVASGKISTPQLETVVRGLRAEYEKLGVITPEVEAKLRAIEDAARSQGAIIEQQLTGNMFQATDASNLFTGAAGKLPPVLKTNAFAAADAAAATLGLTHEQGMAVTSMAENGQEAAILAAKLKGDYGPAVQASTEKMLGLAEASEGATDGLGGFFKGIKTGIPVVDGFLGKIGGFFDIFNKIGGLFGGEGEGGGITGKIGGFFGKIGGLFGGGGEKEGEGGGGFFSKIGGLFGKGGESAGNMFTDAAGGIMSHLPDFIGKAMNFIPVIGPLISMFAGPLMKGIKALGGKIWGGIKGLFGGPSAAEKDARGIANAYNSVFRDMVGANQAAAEGITETWQFNNVAQRDTILALGGSVADVEATWARFKNAAKDPKIAAEFDAFWKERVDKVSAASEATGLTLVELRDKAINSSKELGISVAEAFDAIANGTIETMKKATEATTEAAATQTTAVTEAAATQTAAVTEAAVTQKEQIILNQQQAIQAQQQALADASAAQVEAANKTVSDTKIAVAETVKTWTTAKEQIREAFDGFEIDIPIEFDTTNFKLGDGGGDGGAKGPKLPGFATGGTVSGPKGRAQLAIVHGGEEITPPGKRDGGSIEIPLTLDGREITRAVIKLTPEVRDRLGI